MADDLERLVVQLSADFRSYENAMARATGITRQQLRQLKAEAANVGGAAGAGFDGAAAGVTRYGRAAQGAARGVGSLQAQTGNLAAQFQDIAVQLQSGTNPLTIALQQGTQISAVFGGMGARGAVAALGGAFAALVSPVSLATIAIVGLGGAAVQYFSSLLNDGEKSAEELKKQSALIQQVAKDWGEAVPALKAYADELERAAKIESLREAGEAAVSDFWSEPREQVEAMRRQVQDLTVTLTHMGQQDASSALSASFQALRDKVKDGTASGEDAQEVFDILNGLMVQGRPIAEGLASGMSGLAGALDEAANSSARLQSGLKTVESNMQTFRRAEGESRQNWEALTKANERFVDEQARRNALTAEQLELESEIARVKREAEDAGGLISPADAERVARERIEAEVRRAGDARQTEGLQQQQDAVRRLAAEWAGAVPSLQAYVDELDRAQRSQDAIAAQEAVVGDIWEPARESTQQIASEFEALIQQLSDMGASTEQIAALRDAFADLEEGVKNGTATTQENDAVTAALASLIQGSGIPAVSGFANAFAILAGQIANASAAARVAEADFDAAADASRSFAAAQDMRDSTRVAFQVQKDFIAEQDRLNGLTSEQLKTEREIASIRSEAEKSGTVIGADEAARIARERFAAEERRAAEERASRRSGRSSSGGGGGGGRSAAASDADREREAVTKLIEQLLFEQSLVGATNIEREKANALRRAGTAATEEQRAQIASIVDATYAETEALRQNEEALERLKGLSKDVLGGLFEDMRDGVEGAELLANALNRVAEAMVTAGINRLIEGAFSGPRGSGIGSILASVLHDGGVVGSGGPKRRVAATAFLGAPRFHGGGEVPAILLPGERVLNRREAASYGKGGAVLNYSPVIDARGADMAAVARLEAVVKAQSETFRDRVNEAIGDPRLR